MTEQLQDLIDKQSLIDSVKVDIKKYLRSINSLNLSTLRSLKIAQLAASLTEPEVGIVRVLQIPTLKDILTRETSLFSDDKIQELDHDEAESIVHDYILKEIFMTNN